MDNSCLICGGAVQQAGVPRCDVCRALPREQLVEHGFELDVESHLSKNGGSTFHVTAPQPTTSQLAVVLSEEHFGRKVQKLFTDELEIGDASFDRKVYIQYAEAEDVDAFRQPWVQTLILQLVPLGQLSITEGHAKVHVRTHTTMRTDEIYATLAMLISALDRVRRGQLQ